MRKIRTFALAVALALSAFYLVPAAVSAADKAVDIKGKASASGRLELATGFVTEAGSGTLSHLGKFTYRLAGEGKFNYENGTFSGSGSVTIVGANGDELSGGYTVTGTQTSGTAVITITGGTGRFAGASGTLTMTATTAMRLEGQFVEFDVAETWDGQIVKGPKPKGPKPAHPADSESSDDVAAVAPPSPLQPTPPPTATTEPPANTRVLPDAGPSPDTTMSSGTAATEPESTQPAKPRTDAGKPGDSTISGPDKRRANGAPSGTSAGQSSGD